jgi:hypothetical protein
VNSECEVRGDLGDNSDVTGQAVAVRETGLDASPAPEAWTIWVKTFILAKYLQDIEEPWMIRKEESSLSLAPE